MKDISKIFFWQLIVLLVIIRIFSVVFLMMGVPETGCFDNYFPSCTGGDEEGYFFVAKSFSEFRAEDSPNFGTIGAALVYVPFIWATSADDFRDITKPVFLFQAFVMYSLAIIVVSFIGKLIFRNNLLGFITGAIFTLYPYAVYLSKLGQHNEHIANFKHLMWAQPVLSDPPSAFFTFLGILLFLLYLEKKHIIITSRWLLIATGLICGYAALTRVSNVMICVAIGIVLLGKKYFKEFIVFFVVSFSVFSLQLWFNYVNYGDFLHFSKMNSEIIESRLERYQNVHPQDTIAKPGLDPANYFYFILTMDKYIPFFKIIFVLMISCFVFVSYYIYKKDGLKTVLLLISWLFFYLLFYGGFGGTPRNFRYLLPIVPVCIILFIYLIIMSSSFIVFTLKNIKSNE